MLERDKIQILVRETRKQVSTQLVNIKMASRSGNTPLLTNLPAGYKYLTRFPPPWEPVPPHLTLRQICWAYPNHLDYEGLDPFIQWGWSGDQIWNTIPNYIQERIVDEEICKAQKPSGMYLHRRDRRCAALGGKAGVKRLWESNKLRHSEEDYGNQEIGREAGI